MAGILQVASIIVSILLIILIMLQIKGNALGSLLGGDGGGITRTRRGLEKTIFQITVMLCVAFLAISMFSVVAAN